MRITKLFVVLILIFSSLQPALAQIEREVVEREIEREEVEGEINIISVLRRMFPDTTIEYDPIRNTLIITATSEEQRQIEEMIEQLDIYTPQITIEAKLIELTVNDINELGIDLDILNLKLGSTRNKGDFDLTTDWADSDAGFPATEAASGVWFTRLSNTAFNVLLQALDKQKKVNLLSAPRVTTLNSQAATIQLTRTIPYVSEVEYTNIGTADFPIWQTNYTIEELDSGIYLEVTPTVPEGSTLITLDIKPTIRMLVRRLSIFSEVTEEKLYWPVIDERTTDTSMVISSGQTVVLGGLIRQEESEIKKQVPILGSIPLLGRAFRYDYKSDEKKNLLIFVTAYLVSPRGEKILAER